jgi:hypothetical protein
MMFGRILVVLVLSAGLQTTAMAADFGGPKAAGRQVVPGALVTLEHGVRVIRPLPFDPAWVVDDETEIPGGVVYRGAAFYRVPGPSAKAAHKSKPE